ncbi:MAG: hypothetical protein KAT43_05420 [Nanoarchaeota archaeon]|nr:hypothetical protein [Nanoarchaeota archaeon]
MKEDIYEVFDCRTHIEDLDAYIKITRVSRRDPHLESRVFIPLDAIGRLFSFFLKKLDNEWWQVPSLVEWREINTERRLRQKLEWDEDLESLCQIDNTTRISFEDDEIGSIVFSQGEDRLSFHPAEIYRLIYGLQNLDNIQKSGVLRSIFGQWEKVRKVAPDKTLTQLPFLDTGKGDFQNTCLCYANFDIGASGACFNSILPTGEIDHENACAYCYSNLNNRYMLPYKRSWSNSWTRMFDIGTFIEFQRKERNFEPMLANGRAGDSRIVKGGRFKYIRMGKNIEVGHIMLRNNLLVTMRHLKREGVKFILPTKVLGYDKAVEEFAKDTDSIIHFSLSDQQLDVLERGVHAWGCGHEFRMRSADEYRRAGLKVAFRMVDLVDDEQSERVKALVEKTLDEKQIPVLFTPMRIYNFNKRTVAQVTGGLTRDEMKEKRGYANQPAITRRQHTSILLPPRIHPSYLKLQAEHPELFGFCAHTRRVITEKNTVATLFGDETAERIIGDEEEIFCGACMTGLSHGRFNPTHAMEYTKGTKKKYSRKK